MSISASYLVGWIWPDLECLAHFLPLPSFCFYLKLAGKFQWALKALWAAGLDFNFVGQEGAYLTLNQSHHVHQLLGSLVTSGAEEGKESVTFSLFVLKISRRIKSLGSHLPLPFPIILASFLSFFCFPVRRPPALQAVLCYVLICMRMHLATFYVCWVVQETLTHVHVLSLTHTRFNNTGTLLHFFNFGFLIHQMGVIFQRKLSWGLLYFSEKTVCQSK